MKNKPHIALDMNFCRRCGAVLQALDGTGTAYDCTNGHRIFGYAATSAGVILLNDHNEALLVQRNNEPFKGTYSIPGGFCNFAEPPEVAAMREVEEEVAISPASYTPLSYIHSSIEEYPFRGEVLASMVTVYMARLAEAVQPRVDNESQLAVFMSFSDINLDSIQFPAVREALRRVRDSLDNKP